MFRRASVQGLNVTFRRSNSKIAGAKPSAPSSSPACINANVPGLTNNCVKSTTHPVGPGAAANAPYKVPEYFNYNRFSFSEAEIEMAKYRCPQPSALK